MCGRKNQGIADPIFELLQKNNFDFFPSISFSPLQRTRSYPPTSETSPSPIEASSASRSLVIPQVHRFVIPPYQPL